MHASQEMEGLPVTSSPLVSSGAKWQMPSSHLPGPERTWVASVLGEGGLSAPSLRLEQWPALPKRLGVHGPERQGSGPLFLTENSDGGEQRWQAGGPAARKAAPGAGRSHGRGTCRQRGAPAKSHVLGTRVGGSGKSPSKGATGTGAPGRQSSQGRTVRTPNPRRVFFHRVPRATPSCIK